MDSTLTLEEQNQSGAIHALMAGYFTVQIFGDDSNKSKFNSGGN
jgi:hypothetical protein